MNLKTQSKSFLSQKYSTCGLLSHAWELVHKLHYRIPFPAVVAAMLVRGSAGDTRCSDSSQSDGPWKNPSDGYYWSEWNCKPGDPA